MPVSYVEKLRIRKRRMYMGLILMGSLLLLTFIAFALFGDSGILVNMRVKREYQRLAAERDKLFYENEQLRDEIEAFKNSDRKIEAISRKEFGFGRPGEVIFYFPEDTSEPIQEITVDQSLDKELDPLLR